MKKKFYFATLVIALLTFTGCANDEYVGDQQNLGEQNAAIAFSTKSENTVRATEWTGSNAADRLNQQFWVYGTKTGNAITTPLVFDNYRVEYTGNTSGPYSPKGWEYVGKGGNDKPQTIKYWDYSATKYDFEAYSYKKHTNGTVTKQTEGNDKGLEKDDYVVDNVDENECATLYFAEKKTVQKSSTTPGDKYQDPVKLSFKSVLSKIRVGFYETIPGYSVKITKFYGPNAGGNGWANEDDGSKFVAWCPNKKIEGNMSFVVSYDGTTPAVTKVKKDDDYQAISTAGSPGGYTLNQKLELGGDCLNQTIGTRTQSSNVTWDQYEVNNGPSKYTYVIPQNDDALWDVDPKIVQPMKIKVDYTLTSTDGSREEIHVKGATAIVPAEYLRWEPNKAYSYVFRISDRTNGNTGTDPSTDPAGLYPITFDAVVEDMAESTDHLTTVSDLSITATQGKQFAEADKAVFKTGEEIKVKVMRYNNESPQDITSDVGTPTSGNSFKVAYVTGQDYDYTKSINYNLHEQTLSQKTYDTTDKVIKLESKDTAGYWIVEVTYKDGGKTIIKYAVLVVKVKNTTPSTGSGV